MVMMIDPRQPWQNPANLRQVSGLDLSSRAVSSVTKSSSDSAKSHAGGLHQQRRAGGGHPGRKRYSFKRELFQLWDTITTHCYRQMVQKDRSIWERLMWFFILVIEAAVLAAILNTAWIGFTSSPLITTLHDTLYPVQNVPFPAISLCNNNRISRAAAVRYAEVLARKDPDGRNVSYFLEQVRLLGKLYDFDYENLHQMTQFQEFLDVHDISNASGIFSAFEALTKVGGRVPSNR
ncbi:hypothetical protein quinque_013568 [Culex quinquefasciatus]